MLFCLQTEETYFLVSQSSQEVCQPHNFSVTAMNEVGNSSTYTIRESIPISEIKSL